MELRQIVESLDTDGGTLVEGILSDRECQDALEGIAWAMETQAGPLPLQRQRTYEYFRDHPIFVELVEHPLVIAVAEACLGPKYHLICAEITRNERENHYLEVVKNIHQDHCFFPDDLDHQLDMQIRMYGFTAQWVILDIPLEMGPTEFIVGSHNTGKQYTNEEAPSLISFQNHFPKGSLLLYDHRVWHRGTDNRTQTPRDLIQNCYARHAVDKVQIRTPQSDGADIYIPCSELLETGSDTLRRLLSQG